MGLRDGLGSDELQRVQLPLGAPVTERAGHVDIRRGLLAFYRLSSPDLVGLVLSIVPGNLKIQPRRHNMSVVAAWDALRGLLGRALLVLVLGLTQTHFCEANYVRPSGESCLECASIADHAEPLVGQADVHGDCHDCCEIRKCENPDNFRSQSQLPWVTLAFAILPTPVVLPDFGDTTSVRDHFSIHEGAPSTGPPSISSTRGPPLEVLRQPSAGCKVMSLA